MRRCRHRPCKTSLPKVKDCQDILSREGFCNFECKVQYGLALGRKRLEAERRAQERAQRQEREAAKERLKTRRDYIKDAQQVFNSYIRARDAGLPCASCGSLPGHRFGGGMDCSHYRSVGSAPHMRFVTFNAVAACKRCNRELSGNVVELRKGLFDRFGLEIVERVEQDETVRRHDIDWLKRFIRIFRKRTRHIQRLRERLGRAA